MTRKDYVKLAGALAEARADAIDSPEGLLALENVRGFISDVLAADNPNFDRHRFRMAAIGQPVTGRDRPQRRDTHDLTWIDRVGIGR